MFSENFRTPFLIGQRCGNVALFQAVSLRNSYVKKVYDNALHFCLFNFRGKREKQQIFFKNSEYIESNMQLFARE